MTQQELAVAMDNSGWYNGEWRTATETEIRDYFTRDAFESMFGVEDCEGMTDDDFAQMAAYAINEIETLSSRHFKLVDRGYVPTPYKETYTK